MSKNHSIDAEKETISRSFRFFRGTILFWTLFIGVGALVGTSMFFIDPVGGIFMQGIQEIMQEKMPLGDLLFANLIFPGIALLCVNGLPNLLAFALILRRRRAGYILGFCLGITLMLWICIQFALFTPEIYAIDVVFFIFGLLQLACGWAAYVRYSQDSFAREPKPELPKLTNRRELVVYFSREGYTERLALRRSAELGCAALRLETTEPVAGDAGFWWCGRFAMHRWGMRLRATPELGGYDKVYIFSPVWVFSLCAPVRELISAETGLKDCELTLVHFMNGACRFAFREAEAALGARLTGRHSVRCRLGRYKTIL